MDARSLVLMAKEDGILSKELGSYEIEKGMEFVYKAFVEENTVNLFLTTDRDVEEWEFNEIYDNYNYDYFVNKGYEVEEVEDEYNPTWCVKFEFKDDYDYMEGILNDIIGYHEDEIRRIYEEIKK
jgi:hypothetical protein